MWEPGSSTGEELANLIFGSDTACVGGGHTPLFDSLQVSESKGTRACWTYNSRGNVTGGTWDVFFLDFDRKQRHMLKEATLIRQAHDPPAWQGREDALSGEKKNISLA